MTIQSPAAARRSSKSSGESRRSCCVAHRHKRSPVFCACRISVITQNGEAAKICYLHNAAGQRVFKSEPQTAQTLPNETELGTPFVDWLKRNFQWL
jgi:hypothetical protein